METSTYNIEQLEKALLDSYGTLRDAIIASSKHPDDEAYDYSEYCAGRAYDDALLAYNHALKLERAANDRHMEETGELPF